MKYLKVLLMTVLIGNGVLLFVTPCLPADKQSRDNNRPESMETSMKELISLQIDQEKIQNLTRAMLENGFSEKQVVEALRVIRAARQQNLPLDPLFSKANEGMAKKAGPELIIRAMATVFSRYSFAARQSKGILTNRSSVDSLNRSIVAGLAAGMTEREMEEISVALQQRSRQKDEIEQLSSHTFNLVKDMARLGVSPNLATGLTLQALEKGYSAPQIEELRTGFLSLSQNKDANELAGRFSKDIESGKGFVSPGDHGPSHGQEGFESEGPGSGPGSGFGGGGPGGGGTGSGGHGGGR